jgi:hypothetical protein
MPFIKMDGVDGLVYVPDTHVKTKKKHPCKDCEVCRQCSDACCHICLRSNKKNAKKRKS